jgi:DNA-directed RNA polymerase specialized sigma24 family protein
MIEPSDAELHARILARDQEAFSLWESRTAPAVLRMLQKRGLPSEDAEEVWNDTLAVTWGRALREPPIEPLGEGLRRFAFGVARRLIAKRLGARSRQVQTVPLDDRDQDVRTGEFDPVSRPSKLVHALRRCLEMVDERVRIIVSMVMINAEPDEIASAIGISAVSVSKYVQRAKATLRRCIEGETDV